MPKKGSPKMRLWWLPAAIAGGILLAGCGRGGPVPVRTPTPAISPSPTSTPTANPNPASNPSASPGSSPAADRTPPVITSFRLEQAVYDLVEVIWRTNEPTIGRLEYGLAPNIEFNSPWTTVMSTDGGSVQTGLQHYGLYSFRIRVKDAAGNETVSPEHTLYLWAVAGEGTPRVLQSPSPRRPVVARGAGNGVR